MWFLVGSSIMWLLVGSSIQLCWFSNSYLATVMHRNHQSSLFQSKLSIACQKLKRPECRSEQSKSQKNSEKFGSVSSADCTTDLASSVIRPPTPLSTGYHYHPSSQDRQEAPTPTQHWPCASLCLEPTIELSL